MADAFARMARANRRRSLPPTLPADGAANREDEEAVPDEEDNHCEVSSIQLLQINLQHSKAASAELCARIGKLEHVLAIIQEPWTYKNSIAGLRGQGCSIYTGTLTEKPRTCIVTKGLSIINLPQLGNKDQTAVRVKYSRAGKVQEFILASTYLPSTDNTIPTVSLTNLVHYSMESHTPLVIGCDSNSHHVFWGSADTNDRGTLLLEYLLSTNLQIVNKGNVPTFDTGRRRSVIDLTLVSTHFTMMIKDWHVESCDSMSDHRYINFKIENDAPVPLFRRNPRTTDWESYGKCLEKKLALWARHLDKPSAIEDAVQSLQADIIEAYESACPLKRVKHAQQMPWMTKEVRFMRRMKNNLWHRYIFSRSEADWEKYKKVRNQYKRTISKAKKESWRKFCRETSTMSESARLYKILSRNTDVQLGMLRKSDGEYTQSTEEVLDHLLTVHFPGNTVVDEPGNLTYRSNQSYLPTDWNWVKTVITPGKVEWSFSVMLPYKSPGLDGIFPILLQKGSKWLKWPVCQIYRACLNLGYTPRAWRTARVVFVPKPGKPDYSIAKAFRPISLTSFLLKGMERLVDRYLRDGPLKTNPLHGYQHAFQPGKSTETALSWITAKIETALNNKQYALAVFFDIEGAFDHVRSEDIIKAFKDHGIDDLAIKWISELLTNREILVEYNDIKVRRTPGKGMPQGGGLSPLLWLMVANRLLKVLNDEGMPTQFFADDGTIVLVGSVLSTLCELMQSALARVEHWCRQLGLSVNPTKTEMVLFTRRRKPEVMKPITFYGVELQKTAVVKYLGVFLDEGLNWKHHVDQKCSKVVTSLAQLRRIAGKTWGTSPKVTSWLYTAVIRPIISYAAIVWWPRVQLKSVQRQLNKIQRLACLYITGCVRTTPTVVLEILNRLVPLHLHILSCAAAASCRLNASGQWKDTLYGHRCIRHNLKELSTRLLLPIDYRTVKYNFQNIFYIDKTGTVSGKNDLHTKTYYTDGSRKSEQTGAGVYCAQTGEGHSYALGQFCTIFQAELFAINICVSNLIETEVEETEIYIYTDSKAVLSALESPTTRSNLVAETVQKLNRLAANNCVTVGWVISHSGVVGNERADRLAKSGARFQFIGPEPAIYCSTSYIKSVIMEWAGKEQYKLWNAAIGCRQAKAILPSPCDRISVSLRNLQRQDLRAVVGVLSGHAPVARHLFIMKLCDSPMCTRCGLAEETTAHFLCDCEAFSSLRLQLLGKPVLAVEEVKNLSVYDIAKYIRKSKRFLTYKS